MEILTSPLMLMLAHFQNGLIMTINLEKVPEVA